MVAARQPPQQLSTRPTSAQGSRRRGRGACQACHIRKVRCDVSAIGQPCTHCSTDKVRCLLRERKNRRLPLGFEQDHAVSQEGGPQTDLANEVAPVAPQGVLQPHTDHNRAQASDLQHPYHQRHDRGAPGMASEAAEIWNSEATLPSFSDFLGFGSAAPPSAHSSVDVDYGPALAELENFLAVSNNLGASPENCWNQPPNELCAQSPLSAVNHVSSPSGSNLQIELSEEQVMGTAEDRQFLISQGCFRLPESSVLREIGEVYFSFIHPNLPMLNEGDFWRLWDGHRFKVEEFSILVIQSMLFASASFIPDAVLARCGFRSTRQARLKLYRKAKLLYDFGVESDPVLLAQSCLLLTYYAPNNNRTRINSSWLMNSIRFAKVAKADKFYEVTDDKKKYRMLKRLWWCCILRDRILPLGVRRPIQIDVDMSEQGDSAFLHENDMEDERGLSAVHDAETQSQIFHILALACRLANALTPALKILFTVENANDRLKTDKEPLSSKMGHLNTVLSDLFEWHEQASKVFPSPVNLGDTHRSTIIFANLLFVYFDAAIIALCSHSLLLVEVHDTPTHASVRQSATMEIVRAVTDTADRTRELVQMNLTPFLPISFSAFLCLPFLLVTLNAMIASGTNGDATAQRQLEIFAKAMRVQQINYDGADFCHELLGKVMVNVRDDNSLYRSTSPAASGTQTPAGAREHQSQWGKRTPGARPSKRSGAVGWEDLLHKRPLMFLRLAMHVDIALCTGGTPQEEEFPPQLRRQKQGGRHQGL